MLSACTTPFKNFSHRFRVASLGEARFGLPQAAKGDVDENNACDRKLWGRFALLATGVVDLRPNIPDVETAVEKSLIRYCPICDGYEAKDKKVAVIAYGDRCLGEATFIANTYTSDVTLLSYGQPLPLTREEQDGNS